MKKKVVSLLLALMMTLSLLPVGTFATDQEDKPEDWIGYSSVELNGDRVQGIRSEETNLGDLVADSIRWYASKNCNITVDESLLVSVIHAGVIREWIHEGDVTEGDIYRVLPFDDTVTIVYVTGEELLEALEASTYSTPDALTSFPQIAGMEIWINTSQEYDQSEQYPDSTFYAPNSIRRVSILSVNGKPFNPKDTYAVATNNFCAFYGDTYFAFKGASKVTETDERLAQVLIDYIIFNDRQIGEPYAEPQGRIQISAEDAPVIPQPTSEPSKAGKAAFQYLMQTLTDNGDLYEGMITYHVSPQTYSQKEWKNTSFMLFTSTFSNDNVLRISATEQNRHQVTTYLDIPSNLAMPYKATLKITESGKSTYAYAEIDAAFIQSKKLKVYDKEGNELSGGWQDYFPIEIGNLLRFVHEVFLAEAGYSIGDLGFAAFVQEQDYNNPERDTESDTPTVMPKGPEAYEKLLEILKQTGRKEVKTGTLTYEITTKNELELEFREKEDADGIFGVACIVIPRDLSMSYYSYYLEYQRNKQSLDTLGTAITFLKSSFSPYSKFTYIVNSYNPDGRRYFTLLIDLLKTTQELLNGTGYSIGDLGFTAFADDMGYPYSTYHELVAVRDADATCDMAGLGAFWKCIDCGKYFSDADGNNELSAPVVIPSTGHSWSEWEITKPATEKTTGEQKHICSVCGKSETQVIPKIKVNPFDDVNEGAYYYEPVLWAVKHTPQITNGTSANTFSPLATCTRDQIVTFLWRAMGCPEPTSMVNPFVDVQPSDYFYKPVLWAVEKGITNGMDLTHFGPTVPCSRAHVVTFLWRAHEKPAAGTNNPFADVPAGQYYTDAVLWAVSKNITNGMDATHFGPDAPCQRGQIVTFLYRDLK